MDISWASFLGDVVCFLGMLESKVFELFSSEGLGKGFDIWGIGNSDEEGQEKSIYELLLLHIDDEKYL